MTIPAGETDTLEGLLSEFLEYILPEYGLPPSKINYQEIIGNAIRREQKSNPGFTQELIASLEGTDGTNFMGSQARDFISFGVHALERRARSHMLNTALRTFWRKWGEFKEEYETANRTLEKYFPHPESSPPQPQPSED